MVMVTYGSHLCVSWCSGCACSAQSGAPGVGLQQPWLTPVRSTARRRLVPRPVGRGRPTGREDRAFQGASGTTSHARSAAARQPAWNVAPGATFHARCATAPARADAQPGAAGGHPEARLPRPRGPVRGAHLAGPDPGGHARADPGGRRGAQGAGARLGPHRPRASPRPGRRSWTSTASTSGGPAPGPHPRQARALRPPPRPPRGRRRPRGPPPAARRRPARRRGSRRARSRARRGRTAP